jgi:hypothetical protein
MMGPEGPPPTLASRPPRPARGKTMDLRLHFLESFMTKGSDGERYKVMGYERMAPDAPSTHGMQEWESTGIAEYHLVDGRLVQVEHDGSMHIVGSGVELVPEQPRRPGAAR